VAAYGYAGFTERISKMVDHEICPHCKIEFVDGRCPQCRAYYVEPMCVCGCRPPEQPNDDCERCQLIVENARLIRQASETMEIWKMDRRSLLAAQAKIKKQNRIIDGLMDACGPAADDVIDMIEQEIEK